MLALHLNLLLDLFAASLALPNLNLVPLGTLPVRVLSKAALSASDTYYKLHKASTELTCLNGSPVLVVSLVNGQHLPSKPDIWKVTFI